ncbi:hypothetical protein P4H65_27065 [Paenibacillus chitinolyticus]|uniref:hypothetical protein n=1 Tax=Paenibacillus chitinolyticus TaxID=79263 RepID=UPI002DBAED4A|nr:hypothetical protein [Paenibacillus chitinolyticus]MEC0249446.1 hypothetical protein [Paenibacillus chitinolyticus]
MTLNNKRNSLPLLASILAVLGFIAFTSNLTNSNPSITLYVFNPVVPLTEEQLKGLDIDVVSYNPPMDKFKITSYPTYVLVKTKTQELIGITNDFTELGSLRKKSN